MPRRKPIPRDPTIVKPAPTLVIEGTRSVTHREGYPAQTSHGAYFQPPVFCLEDWPTRLYESHRTWT